LLGRKQDRVVGRGAEDREGDIPLGGPHDVEMVLAHVRDHPVRGADHLLFREGLEVRLQRHALDHQRAGAVPRREGDDTQLFDDIRARLPKHGVFRAIIDDDARQGPGRLGDCGNPARAQAGGDKPGHRGLTPGAIDMNADRDGPKISPMKRILDNAEPDQDTDQEHENSYSGHTVPI